MSKNIENKRVFNMLYTGLILYLVFTIATVLLQGFIRSFSIALILYILLWLFLTIQAIFAYLRVKSTKPQNYPLRALLSDCLDIFIAIYVCTAIVTAIVNGGNELSSYLHLSIPFIVLSLNQFSWFVLVKNFDIPALFRISILFCGMLSVSVSELICHGFWNFVLIVVLIVGLGILRAIDKAPKSFGKLASRLWFYVKKKYHIKPQH